LCNWGHFSNFAVLYPRTMKKLIVFLLLNACMVVVGMSQSAADSVRIHFRPRSSRMDPDYGDNTLHSFLQKVRKCDADGSLERLIVRAYTSPDGVSTVNLKLSADRCQSVADYIMAYLGIDPAQIDILPGGIAWEELRCMIAADSRVPGRQEALGIIDYTPVWVYDAYGRIVGGRKKSLMDLLGGQTYRWLRQHFFDRLHGASVVLCVKEMEKKVQPLHRDTVRIFTYIVDSVVVGSLRVSDFPVIKSTYADKSATVNVIQADAFFNTDTLPSQELVLQTDRAENGKIFSSSLEDDRLPVNRLALKTNLLYAAALLPSIELEWRLNNCWTMAVEGNMAWWKKRKAHKCYQLAVASGTVRRWFHNESLRKGLYAGAFVGAGLYDFENGRKGYRGEGVLAGLGIGYLYPVSKRLAIEAEAGGGWMMTRYKEYIPYEGHHLYVRTQNMNFFGPLRLKLSLVWLLGRTVCSSERKGGGK